ncbi:class I SAM-dependent methyltransferase [Nocardiopsis composta]|uniref:SAM-dependent methyltransferase n=1 Tax=Nocardiopsis composta TaxID=157465 RepID=A0A7W8QIM7_9ACTN|nr:class I SAM-dependent methyltransferase [Nocardiopsis composta]MBB5431086.1 SAM-dependent methyltransferase [Nocardiopsis composta]
MAEEFTAEYWEERYRGHGRGHGAAGPNPQLVAEAAGLAPGTALDAGCGEGAEALWLAEQGWRVTAVDIAGSALDRARERAEGHGAGLAGRIDWVQADLTRWDPGEDRFDLVCTHYVHPAGAGERDALFRRLAAAVAPGGTLVVVGHHPTDRHSAEHTRAPDVHVTAEEIAAGLDPRTWDVAVAESRTRSLTGPGGAEITFSDTVLRARKHG